MSSRREDEDLGLAADEPLCAFVDQVRSTYAFGPPPQIGPGLSAVLTRGLGTGGPAEVRLPAPAAGPARRAWRLADALQGRRARLGLGAAVASLTFLGTGVAGALPGPAQAAFERTADVVGIELPETARRDPAPAPAESEPDAGTSSPTGGGDAPDSPGVGAGGENPDPGSSPPPVAGRPDNSPPAAPQPGPPGDAGGAGEGLGREPGQGRPDGVPAPTVPQPAGRPGAGPPPGVPGPVGDAGAEADRDEADSDEAGGTAGRGNAPAAGPRAAGETPAGPTAGGSPDVAGPGGISRPR